MKISVNAIRAFNERYHSAPDLAPEGVEKLVERIGAQLAAVEEVVLFGAKYQGVVIVRVVDCRKHEKSEHLNICTIDDGGITPDVKRDDNGHIQVVCGAPNVRAGLTVAWLPPGATVPSSYDSDPFVLSVREIRGVVSNGMLASPKELALGDSHDGILEIDEDIAPGTRFSDTYNLVGDHVIDMENKMFTHRPDCFGMLGVAREIAGIQGQKFTSPAWYRRTAEIAAPETAALWVEVRNEIPDLVPRFVAVPLSGITVRPSPVWLQVELSRLGMRPINNIVDLTNYYMLLTGQPLHAYDYDKVAGLDGSDKATIVIRQPRGDEQLTLLNGKTITPRSEAIVIASDSKAIGLGGVMGGAETEVDETTRNIIVECASFDMYSIRRTSMAHGLFSDAVTRFNKGQSPLQNMAVLAQIVSDIGAVAGGVVAGSVVDDCHVAPEIMERGALHVPVSTTAVFINARLGLSLTSTDMADLLRQVEFDVKVQETELLIKAPFWRTDIEIAEDIVEEIGRLYGYDRLPVQVPRRVITPAQINPVFELQRQIRSKLTNAGANEVLTYSFVHGNMIDKAEQNRQLAYKLSNALSPDLQYYRLSLTPSLLDKVHANSKSGYDEFAIYEIGKAHIVGTTEADGLPTEFERLAGVFAADNKKAQKSYRGAAFYQARAYLMTVLQSSEQPYRLAPFNADLFAGNTAFAELAAPYNPARAAVIMQTDTAIGIVGEYKASVRKAFKLPAFCAGFELSIAGMSLSSVGSYQTLSKFPKIEQDISLRVNSNVSYQQLHDVLWDSLLASQPPATLLHVSPLDIYQGDDPSIKQLTFRLNIASYDKTMTDREVQALLETAAADASDKLGAERL